MAMTATGDRGARSAINVTPLIDVLLVLLIIFMVIQPTVPRGLGALAPKPSPAKAAMPDPRTLVVLVSGNGDHAQYTLNGQPINLAELQPQLQRIVQRGGRRPLFVTGSSQLEYAAIAPVFNAAHAAGEDEVGILTPTTLRE